MRNTKKFLGAVACAVVVAFGFTATAAEKKAPAEKAPAAEKAAPAEKPAKEVTVKGTLVKGKAEGSFEIKAGKKVLEVDPASPKAADLAGLLDKKVEVKGTVKEKVITVTEIKEMAERKKAEKKEVKEEKK